MSIPPHFELERIAREIVRAGKKENRLHELTPRIIRESVAERCGLPPTALDAPEYKKLIKAAAHDAMVEEDGAGAADMDVESASKKRKSDAEDGEEEAVAASADTEPTSEVKPKPKPQRKPSQQTKKDSKAYKSAAVIASSDIEDENVKTAAIHNSSKPPVTTKRGNTPPKQESSPPKKRRKLPTSDDEEDAGEGHKIRDTPVPSSSTLVEDSVQKSESEMSVLIDEPPKKAKKSKPKAKDDSKKAHQATKEKEKKPKKAGVELSKDEETIKRLKSFVVACGVRKVWAKEFQGMDRPSEQIRHLKKLLADLGMSGRMSLERAKAIKEKRELAKELEDVQSFEKSIAAQSSRTRNKVKQTTPPPASDADEAPDSDEEMTEMPVKRKNNARLSIMAFLGDQSDED